MGAGGTGNFGVPTPAFASGGLDLHASSWNAQQQTGTARSSYSPGPASYRGGGEGPMAAHTYGGPSSSRSPGASARSPGPALPHRPDLANTFAGLGDRTPSKGAPGSRGAS